MSTVTVRPAVASDRKRLVEMMAAARAGAAFDDPYGVTGFVFPFLTSAAEALFLLHVQRKGALALVLEVDGRAEGLLLATAGEHPFGPVRMARETLWWIEPTARGRGALAMLAAYEGWARAEGCAFAGMAGMGPSPDVAAIYARRGYRAAEVHYLKAL